MQLSERAKEVPQTPAGAGQDNQIIRDLLQASADVDLKDWFEFSVGSPMMDLTAATNYRILSVLQQTATNCNRL